MVLTLFTYGFVNCGRLDESQKLPGFEFPNITDKNIDMNMKQAIFINYLNQFKTSNKNV